MTYWGGVLLPVCLGLLDEVLGPECGPSVVPYWLLALGPALVIIGVMTATTSPVGQALRITGGVLLSVAIVLVYAIVNIGDVFACR